MGTIRSSGNTSKTSKIEIECKPAAGEISDKVLEGACAVSSFPSAFCPSMSLLLSPSVVDVSFGTWRAKKEDKLKVKKADMLQRYGS